MLSVLTSALLPWVFCSHVPGILPGAPHLLLQLQSSPPVTVHQEMFLEYLSRSWKIAVSSSQGLENLNKLTKLWNIRKMTFYMWDTKKGPPQIQTAQCESPEHEPFWFYRPILHTLHIFFSPNTPSSIPHSFSIISYIIPTKHGLLLCGPTQPCFRHLPHRLSPPQPALTQFYLFVSGICCCPGLFHFSLLPLNTKLTPTRLFDSSHTGGFVLPSMNR